MRAAARRRGIALKRMMQVRPVVMGNRPDRRRWGIVVRLAPRRRANNPEGPVVRRVT